jgi:hypothetical protein
MTVRSQDMYGSQQTQPRKTQRDISMTIVMAAVWLIVIPVGGLFIAINGGYSIVGLGTISRAFNDQGQFLWAAATSITFPVPVKVPGLPVTQPAIPWCLVIATSLLQIVIIWRKLKRLPIPTWVLVVGLAVSLYDLATTFFGFGTVDWIQQIGYIVQAPLAILFTFGFEGTLSFLLRKM